MSDITSIWISKFALTTGIQEVRAMIIGETAYVQKDGSYIFYSGNGREWHRTLALALAKAEAMREGKIRSLERKLIKINKLEIKVERIDL